ncbi:uncharacterized protein LOC103716606 isoform X2 [Phoenix dactylifera]|uniref:Uncharacterized protein LOC103716606 isoform X2 n=1 Tax=Phoenix dactylifera TaxID=42345 RepID=A0A8B9B1W1_PHODC|nr:uncharacterized protein LOC103716606 isoform X2 [Phoenix dactylifera]
MAAEKKQAAIPPRYDLDAKWDACLDLTIRRFFYSSLAGAFSGLLLFRSPTTRWASVAFGAGVGIGTAYTECSYIFDGSPPKLSPKLMFGNVQENAFRKELEFLPTTEAKLNLLLKTSSNKVCLGEDVFSL